MPELLTVEGTRRNMEKCWQEYAAYTHGDSVVPEDAHRLYGYYLDALERYTITCQLAGIGRTPRHARPTRIQVALVAIGLVILIVAGVWLLASLSMG
ncbi:MAG: hypothetical protein ACXWP0_04365 [Ktedonobacterales bacterium]